MTLVLTLTFATAAVSCGEPAIQQKDDHPARQRTVHEVWTDLRPEIDSLIRESWVYHDGRGLFVEGAWNAQASPFSLYDTYWQVRNGQPAKTDELPLDGQAVNRWVAPGLGGKLQSSEIPPIIQIDYTTHLYAMISQPMDLRLVTDGLDALRKGTRYKSIGSAEETNWGSTAIAVRVMARSDLDIPQETMAAAWSALEAQPSDFDLAHAVTTVVPLLELVSHLPQRADQAARIAAVAAYAQAVLDGSFAPTDIAWLGTRHSLTAATRRLGATVAGLPPATCTRANAENRQADDPQFTYLIKELGCSSRPVEPQPHSRAGWPSREALHDPLLSTINGLRIAVAAGIGGSFAPAVRAMARHVWLPEADGGANESARAIYRMRLSQLSRLLTLAGAQPITEISSAAAPALGDDGAMLLARAIEVLSSGSHGREARARELLARLETKLTTSDNITAAATSEVLFRILGEETLHARALEMLQSLRLNRGLFKVQASDTGVSISASAIGIWIERANLVLADWVEAGLCSWNLRCAESDDADRVAPAMTLHILAVLSHYAAPTQEASFPVQL